MTLLRRSRLLRVLLRASFVLIATETTLSLAAPWIERHAGSSDSAKCEGAIVCVGDSNTFGVGAPPGSSYPDQLQALLAAEGDPRRVVNLGLPGLTTRLILDRLEHALGGARPACVVFLGGTNDFTSAHELFESPAAPDDAPSLATRIHRGLSRLRTWRMGVALARVATGRVVSAEHGGRAEYGGRSASLPDPLVLPGERWAAEYARARRAGLRAQLEWNKVYWAFEIPARMDQFLDDLRARPDFAAASSAFRLPESCCQWEADVVNGRPTGPLPIDPTAPPDAQTFANYTLAWSLLARGETTAARKAFEACGPLEATPWGVGFNDLMLAWTHLAERDWVRARDTLAPALDLIEQLAPPPGLWHALGATALATLLADDRTRLTDFTPAHPAWKEQIDWTVQPLGHEWMVAAECVDAVKSGDRAELHRRLDLARERFGEKPATRPLRWLLAHRDATLDDVRRGIDLEPPRIAWTAERGNLLRYVSEEEHKQIVGASLRRLADLADEHGFPVILLTYLDYEGEVQNRVLCEIATERRWPLVNLQSAFPLTEVGADDKRRYFSPDRFHPNAAGYGLMARALLPVVRQVLGTR